MINPEAEGFHGPEDDGGRRRATVQSSRVLELYSLIGGRVSQIFSYDRRRAGWGDPVLRDQLEICAGSPYGDIFAFRSGDTAQGTTPGTVNIECPR